MLARVFNFAVFQSEKAKTQVFAKSRQGFKRFCRTAKDLLLIDYILEQLCGLGDVTYRPMMGEFIIYYGGKIVGGIYDDRLLVKKTASALFLMPAADSCLPYEGAKEMLLVEEVDDKKFLAKLFESMCGELPPPKRQSK